MLRTIGWLLVSYCAIGLIGTFIIIFGSYVKRLLMLSKVHDGLEDELSDNFDDIMKKSLMDMVADYAGNRAMTIVLKVIGKMPDVICVFLCWPLTYWSWYRYMVPLVDEYCNELIENYQSEKLEDV